MPRGGIRASTPPTDDGWIWGNTRGGGGAPLKDPTGQTVADLRAVVRGEKEVDYSPASPTRRSGYGEDEYGSSSGGKSSSFRGGRASVNEDYDDPYGVDEAPPRRKGGGGRKSVAYADEVQQYDDVDRRRSGAKKVAYYDDEPDNYRVGRGGGTGKAAPSALKKNDLESYESDLGGGGGGRGKARRDRERDRDRDREKERERSPIDNVPDSSSGSPKKYMSSLRLMYTSALPSELSAKARKEQEYQNQLREQIEEKKRKKEDEERKGDELKKKELEEYLRVHYKGKIPDYVIQKLPSYNKHGGGGGDRSFDRSNDESIYNVGRKASAANDDGADFGDDDYPPPQPRKPARGGRRAVVDDDQELSLDIDDHDMSAASLKRRKDKWVSQTEYDELSALCDRLLVQQDTLQSELREQAKLLKTISQAPAGAPRTGRGVSPAMRARSVQNGARRPPMPPAGPLSASKASSMGRPSSIHGLSRLGGGNDIPVPKVAFGRAAEDKSAAAGKMKLPTFGGVETDKRSLLRAGGAATGKLLMKADAKAAAAQQQKRGRGQSPARPSARDPSPAAREGGGFGKLQQLARNTGPVVVSYDEEGREFKGGAASKNKGAQRSLELSGESEYLRIGGEEVDIISGDQLDRLLSKARKARGVH